MEKKKLNLKVIIPMVVLIIIAIIFMSVIMPSINRKGVIKNFAKAMDNKDVSEMLEYIDFTGVVAWNSGFDKDDFDSSEYKNFVNEYKNVEESLSNTAKDLIKEQYNKIFDNGNYEKLYIEGKTNKLGKDLYSIVVQFHEGGEDWGGQGRRTYIIYKGKIIAPFNISLENAIDNEVQNTTSQTEENIKEPEISSSKYNPKEVVEKYENAVSNYTNSSEILENIDFAGTLAWIEAKGNYDEFIKIYDTISADRIQEAENEESKNWSYGSMPKEIVQYEEIKELGEGLYAIKAELKREGTPSFTSYYVVYKDRIVVPTTYTIVNDYLSQYFN